MARVVREIAPELTQTMMEKLDRALDFSWRKINQYVTEEDVFKRSYRNIASYYTSIAGKQALDIFVKNELLVEAFVKHVLQSENVPGEPLQAVLVGETAVGNSQAFIRPLTLRSFSDATYEHTPTTTGKYDLIPTTSGATEEATTKQQAWIILGWMETRAIEVIPYDEIQVTISDEETTRRPLYPRLSFSLQAGEVVKVIEETTPKIVEPGNTLDVDVMIRTANVKFSLWPIGIEVIRADAIEAVGPTG